jgi:hypothetical protein
MTNASINPDGFGMRGTVFTADINGLAPLANDKEVAVTSGLRTRF